MSKAKILSLITAAALIVSLSGCNTPEVSTPETTTAEKSQTTSDAQKETAEIAEDTTANAENAEYDIYSYAKNEVYVRDADDDSVVDFKVDKAIDTAYVKNIIMMTKALTNNRGFFSDEDSKKRPFYLEKLTVDGKPVTFLTDMGLDSHFIPLAINEDGSADIYTNLYNPNKTPNILISLVDYLNTEELLYFDEYQRSPIFTKAYLDSLGVKNAKLVMPYVERIDDDYLYKCLIVPIVQDGKLVMPTETFKTEYSAPSD